MADVDKMSSVVPRACRVVNARCVAAAASMAGLARKIIRRRVHVTTVGRDFVASAADQATFHLCAAAAGVVSGDTVLRTGTFRAIPNFAVDEAGSMVLLTRRVISRRCVAVAASMAGMARKMILHRVPVTKAGKASVEAAAGAASAKNEG
jgi:hypothetical protein